MKKIFIFSLLALFISVPFVGCGNGGGDNNPTTTTETPVPPEDEASGGVGSSDSFSLEIFVTDENGKAVANLPRSRFSVVSSDETLSIDSVTPGTTAMNGNFSSALLLDQSGSMKVNDPFDLRVDSAKTFYSLIDSPNNSSLFAFAGSGDRMLADMVVPYSSGYVTDIDATSVDTLKDLEGGWSPIYDSAHVVLTDLLTAPNENRSLIILSDGDNKEPNGTTYSAQDVIQYANSNDISIHTVGLSEEANEDTLSRLAQETGGSYTLVLEASQLNSAMASLASVLRGDRPVYNVVVVSEESYSSGDTVKGSIVVTLDDGSEVSIPFILTVE